MGTRKYAALPTLCVGLALSAFGGAGCGGGGGSSTGSGPAGAANPGQLSIMLADAPVDGLEKVNVTFTKLEALYDGEAESRARQDDDHAVASAPDVELDEDDVWVTLVSRPVTVDLLDYANTPFDGLFNLVNVNVPSGHYKKFRFTIGAVSLVVNGQTVVVPVSNLAVEVDSECYVSPRERELLVMDFDASRSIEVTGGSVSFNPELRLLQQDDAGTVTGTIQFQVAPPVPELGAAVELVNATGEVVAHTLVEVDNGSGTPQSTGQATFVMHAVPPGTYTLRVTGDGLLEGVASPPLTVQVGPGQSTTTEPVNLSS